MQLLMRRPEIDSFIALAPPADKYDFTFLAPCPASGLFVHGADDTMVPEDSVNTLAKKLQSQKRITIDYKIIEGANHFFHDRVDELTTHVDTYLETQIPAIEAASTTI
jgi:alpha/beta superfamily hydrolase